MKGPDVDIASLSDEKQEQDAKNIREILEGLLEHVDPSNVAIGVDDGGHLNIFVSGTSIGMIRRYAGEDNNGKTVMKAIFEPGTVS